MTIRLQRIRRRASVSQLDKMILTFTVKKQPKPGNNNMVDFVVGGGNSKLQTGRGKKAQTVLADKQLASRIYFKIKIIT